MVLFIQYREPREQFHQEPTGDSLLILQTYIQSRAYIYTYIYTNQENDTCIITLRGMINKLTRLAERFAPSYFFIVLVLALKCYFIRRYDACR